MGFGIRCWLDSGRMHSLTGGVCIRLLTKPIQACTVCCKGGLSVVARAFRRRSRLPVECHRPRQSPAPGFGEKYWSLSGFPSHSLESGGGAFLTVIFGQILAYSAFSDSHFSSPGSLSALMASTGHSGS